MIVGAQRHASPLTACDGGRRRRASVAQRTQHAAAPAHRWLHHCRLVSPPNLLKLRSDWMHTKPARAGATGARVVKRRRSLEVGGATAPSASTGSERHDVPWGALLRRGAATLRHGCRNRLGCWQYWLRRECAALLQTLTANNIALHTSHIGVLLKCLGRGRPQLLTHPAAVGNACHTLVPTQLSCDKRCMVDGCARCCHPAAAAPPMHVMCPVLPHRPTGARIGPGSPMQPARSGPLHP